MRDYDPEPPALLKVLVGTVIVMGIGVFIAMMAAPAWQFVHLANQCREGEIASLSTMQCRPIRPRPCDTQKDEK